MFGFELTEYDKKVYNEELRDFLPDKMIDIHTHVWTKDLLPGTSKSNGGSTWPGRVAADCSVEDLLQTYKDLFPGKTVIPNIFGGTSVAIDVMNSYVLEKAKEYDLPHFYRVTYDMDPEKVEREVLAGGFTGFKPYLGNKPDYIPNNEIRIYDFMPHEFFKIADKHNLAVMMHIARDGRLKDPVNVGQIMDIEQRYPNVKLIVAHVGRAYTESDIGNALDIISTSKNIMFDFCANTLDIAIEKCIEAVGPKRVLFGSDMPISKMRMYRIVEGTNYVNVVPRGLYGDVSGDIHMRETDETDVTNFLYEELRAFKRAAERLSLSKEDVSNIMCKNAERVLGL